MQIIKLKNEMLRMFKASCGSLNIKNKSNKKVFDIIDINARVVIWGLIFICLFDRNIFKKKHRSKPCTACITVYIAIAN